jgi:hypothetical protein
MGKMSSVGVPSAELGTGSSDFAPQALCHAVNLCGVPLRVCGFLNFRCSLRPETSQEHLPTRIAGVPSAALGTGSSDSAP